MKLEKSIEDEIADVRTKRPHVVLLGAGASRQAFPRGERNGKRLPVMADLLEMPPFADALTSAGISHAGRNFEELYSELTLDPGKRAILEELERAVFEYFSSLQLPDEPTPYDHLILSLRPKDVIATFNWDPFLIQAVRRNGRRIGKAPYLLFLHGNVLAGYCKRDAFHGLRGTDCPDAANASPRASCSIRSPRKTMRLIRRSDPTGGRSRELSRKQSCGRSLDTRLPRVIVERLTCFMRPGEAGKSAILSKWR